MITESKVREIARQEVGLTMLLIDVFPRVSFSKALKLLEVSRMWLYRNKQLFDPKRENKRGDLTFSTKLILEYKNKIG